MTFDYKNIFLLIIKGEWADGPEWDGFFFKIRFSINNRTRIGYWKQFFCTGPYFAVKYTNWKIQKGVTYNKPTKLLTFFFSFVNNFGFLGILDGFHGTDVQYKNSMAFPRHFVLKSTKSAREVYPDRETKSVQNSR